MARKSLLFIFCFALISNWVFAQDSTKVNWEEFYPLHIGDFWKYEIKWVETGRTEVETKEVIAETTLSNYRSYKKIARYYHESRLYKYERVDSLGDVYSYYPAIDQEVLVWRLSIAIGEGWWTLDSTSFLKLTDKGFMNAWGDSVIYLDFRQYFFLGGIFWDSSYVRIAQHFGLMYSSPSGCSGASEELVGAGIKGKVYGDTSTLVIGDRKKERIPPKCFILYQNYPNPFNSSTQFRYELSKGGDVTLQIFNLKGELVKTLPNHNQKQGEHSIIWNGDDEMGKNIAAGVYLCQMQFAGQTQTIKIMMIK
ncbi:MAG: T9SS type A sorting domain-containing protein [candidate division KSB1 bacterium]|nr:T9SS type A sorting domain-containing protein [candidate division KSB1 bacterium]